MSVHTRVISLLLLVGSTATAETLYRWVDEQGRVSFQDKPPIKQPFTREEVKSASGSGISPGRPQINITFYAIEECDACDLARQDLINRGLSFTELNPEEDLEIGKSMIERFGKAEVPVLLIGDTMIKGYSPLWLGAELEKAGEPAATSDLP
jgi:glutaredoxin